MLFPYCDIYAFSQCVLGITVMLFMEIMHSFREIKISFNVVF